MIYTRLIFKAYGGSEGYDFRTEFSTLQMQLIFFQYLPITYGTPAVHALEGHYVCIDNILLLLGAKAARE